MDAREHDAFAAGVGRLPSVLGAAFLRVAAREGSWRELGRIAGGEFRQLGTLVDFDPAEGQQGLAATREHLVRWLDALMGELQALRDGLQDGQEPEDYYAVARVAWREWLQKRQLPPEAAELPPPLPPPAGASPSEGLAGGLGLESEARDPGIASPSREWGGDDLL